MRIREWRSTMGGLQATTRLHIAPLPLQPFQRIQAQCGEDARVSEDQYVHNLNLDFDVGLNVTRSSVLQVFTEGG